jgi:hypothetical protein
MATYESLSLADIYLRGFFQVLFSQYLLIVSSLVLIYIFFRILIEVLFTAEGAEVIGLPIIFRSSLGIFIGDFHAADGVFK